MDAVCPKARTPGKPVKLVTVTSLVQEERLPEVRERDWAYCAEPECDVVYFAEDGSTVLKDDLKVRVGIKETGPPHTVCYCFGHTEESIREEVLGTGSRVVESVTARVKAGECSCATMNPKGSCCLDDLRRAVKAASS